MGGSPRISPGQTWTLTSSPTAAAAWRPPAWSRHCGCGIPPLPWPISTPNRGSVPSWNSPGCPPRRAAARPPPPGSGGSESDRPEVPVLPDRVRDSAAPAGVDAVADVPDGDQQHPRGGGRATGGPGGVMVVGVRHLAGLRQPWGRMALSAAAARFLLRGVVPGSYPAVREGAPAAVARGTDLRPLRSRQPRRRTLDSLLRQGPGCQDRQGCGSAFGPSCDRHAEPGNGLLNRTRGGPFGLVDRRGPGPYRRNQSRAGRHRGFAQHPDAWHHGSAPERKSLRVRPCWARPRPTSGSPVRRRSAWARPNMTGRHPRRPRRGRHLVPRVRPFLGVAGHHPLSFRGHRGPGR